MKKNIILKTLVLTTAFLGTVGVKANTIEPEGIHPCRVMPPLVCDSNEKFFTGVMTEKYPDGAVRGTSDFKEGLPDGMLKTFYPNGALETQTIYKAGKENGVSKAYYENGALKVEVVFEDGKQKGMIKAYWENGRLMAEGEQNNRVPTGPQKAYFKNGQLMAETNFKDGKKHGKFLEYYENGKVTGIDIDLAKLIAARLNKKLIIEEMEFDAIISALQSGKADLGISGISATPDRMKNIDFTLPYALSKQVIIVRSQKTTGTVRRSLATQFRHDFIEDARWKYLATGLKHTLVITALAVLIGILLGGSIAVIRVSHDKNGSFPVLNFFCRVYLAVIRGTPVMIQLLIMYYVIFSALNVNKILVAVMAFGINSAAYIAEIIRSGILSVDHGQTEAGRSLGFSFSQTMRFIVLPQALKNALPSLANEFIALIKETSICGYIGLMDLTRGGDVIRSITYDAFLPLSAVALIYLTLILVLTGSVAKLEKRLKRNER